MHGATIRIDYYYYYYYYYYLIVRLSPGITIR